MKPTLYQVEQLQLAIDIMRGACSRAESKLAKDITFGRLVAAVSHELIQGLLNANISLQATLISLE